MALVTDAGAVEAAGVGGTGAAEQGDAARLPAGLTGAGAGEHAGYSAATMAKAAASDGERMRTRWYQLSRRPGCPTRPQALSGREAAIRRKDSI